MSTDLVIINPSAAHGVYGELGDQLIAVEPPLWARLIAAHVRDVNGFSVKIVDAEALKIGGKQAAAIVADMRPQLTCVAVFGHQPSASTQQMAGAREFCAEYYRLQPKGTAIMVGGHPSALPKRTMEDEIVDYVCIGEGPITIEGILEGRDEDQILGLVWEDGDKIRINKSAPLLNCDDLIGDAWDMLPMDRYRAHNWQCLGAMEKRYPYASIYTSLGCPYRCTFCCINAPFESNIYRTRKPDDVVAEIKMLHERYHVETFKITDEMFVLKPSHYLAICEGLTAAGLGDKINIWAYARVDTVQPDNLMILRRAGIRWLALGIESGSEHVRDGAEKHLRQSDIVGTVKAVQEAGINVIGNFMFGLRDDDERTMQATLDLALACLPDFANFYSTMAYPGSGLYAQAIKNKWILPNTWRGYSQHNDDCRPLDTEYLSGKEVLRYRDHAFRAFFGNSRYLAHVKRKFGDEADEHVRKMLGYTLKRKLLEEKVI
jgi:anaerobic magnesium-protoporphyrin IX monomethyl ester cyclase